MLISWTVTAQQICAFFFAYAKSRVSHDAAHLMSYGCRSAVRLTTVDSEMFART